MYSIRSKILESYLGYPNLGRPNDHFEVTPFEAVFCGPEIQPHIRMNEAPFEYVDSLKQFVLNEVEPWYLDLQNMRLGAQARSDYRYYSFRRAKHRITVGEDVTPTTDKGAYIVEPNGKLALHAGDAIILKPGVHFKAGSIVHIKPAYDKCGNTKMVADDGKNNEAHQNIENVSFDKDNILEKEKITIQDFIIYPNPADNTVTIKSNDGSIPENITFYNLQGNEVLENKSNQSLITVDIGNLNAGVYIIRISSNGKMFNKKLLVK
ncbi:MAG: T9SS type A sorting domain-containing protein [Brumimicrobium sp.]